MRSVPFKNISAIENLGLCIGCGFCRPSCRQGAITLEWSNEKTWRPSVLEGSCNSCGACLEACPNTPEHLVRQATEAMPDGESWGLAEESSYFIAFDTDEEKRRRSASGGALTGIFKNLLESGKASGIIASLPLKSPVGEPHSQVQLFRTPEEVEQGRGSHYHPLNYAEILQRLPEEASDFVLAGVPCIIRGAKKLPAPVRAKIRYTFCLVCSHNVSGAFTDCLAKKEGVPLGRPFTINLRDKMNIPNANNFNTCFSLPDREIRRNRFTTAFTDMWRNYFFAQEACFYCPDFWGAEADLSVKDAWGRLSEDPLGKSLLIVRNQELVSDLRQMAVECKLSLEDCDSGELLDSQRATATFKQVEVRDRMVWKNALRREIERTGSPLGAERRWRHPASREYFRLRMIMHLSRLLHFRLGKVPVKPLIWLSRPSLGWKTKAKNLMKRFWQRYLYPLARSGALFLGAIPVRRISAKEKLRVLIAGGYGYGNVGDEAQLAANLQHWKKALPKCRLTVLTPNREYTEEVHGPIRTELATRLSLFGRDDLQYFGSDRIFKRRFFLVAALCLFNARLIRAGMPTFGLSTRQARLLDELNHSDLLFLSGGGYLTGMTLTRLWDNMLLIRLADALGVPTVLSGQTIGVFKDKISRKLAKWGLKKTDMIYLRDHIDSPKDLANIGISAEKVRSTFDDALFYEPAPPEEIHRFLQNAGIDPVAPYLAVNCHYWGQSPEATKTIIAELAKALDRIKEELGLQIVFVPMHSSDEDSIHETMGHMEKAASFPTHSYDPSIAVGLIQNATLCLTMKHHPIVFAMAGKVPVVSCVFDEYYWHKNYGAMSIFSQEDYLIDGRARQELAGELFEKTIEAYSKREEIRNTLVRIVKELESKAGEAIYSWTRRDRLG